MYHWVKLFYKFIKVFILKLFFLTCCRWAVHRNLISHINPLQINIPEQYWNISNYRATLGHKLNHSFKATKSMYGAAYHPRFGEIRSVVAKSDIDKGEEIFVSYNYRMGSLVPEWYSTLYKEEMGDDWYQKNQGDGGSCGCN